jgi:peptidoglycan endopeptidase LytF
MEIVPKNRPAEQEPTKTVVDQKTVISTNGQTVEHTIKAKENLNLLAEKYGTTVEEIKRLNGLSSNNLRIGQVLKIKEANKSKNVVVAPSSPGYTKPKSSL